MRYNIVGYLIGEGIKNIFKNKKSSIASLGIMCCTMFIFGIFFAIGQNVNHILDEVKSTQGMRVFILNDASEEEVEEIGAQIRAIEGVKTAVFVSRQESLDEMKEMLGDKKYILNGVDSSFISVSYMVTLSDLTLNESVQAQINQLNYIKSIKSMDSTISKLIDIANGIKWVTMIIFVLLIAISIFIISNTIKLAVHARRKEISIMKYVGATNSFIRWPFIVEGIIIGVVAAGLTLLLLAGAYEFAITQIIEANLTEMTDLSLLGFNNMLKDILIVYLILGIGVGVIGSSISMKKYLEV